ncbi:MAG: 1-deoxy-D-xylulose-5-phosphate synthase N-terminal domain-containing protein, partial [Planctomycetaceae bacterium]
MSFEILTGIRSPRDLQGLSDAQLLQLASEVREALLTVVEDRAAHFSSNLGVVELCIA